MVMVPVPPKPPSKLPAAAFTITWNEPFFLKVWCGYHCKQFGAENVWVLDDSSTDSSVQDAVSAHPGLNVVTVPPGLSFDCDRLRAAVQGLQIELLERYEVVVFSETDEYLIPDTGTLFDFCRTFQGQSARATGWGVVHQIRKEPALAIGCGDILSDRNSMWRLPKYDKTLVSRVPLRWSAGFHNTWDAEGERNDIDSDLNLALFHAWMVDLDVFWSRRVERQKMQLHPEHAPPHGCDDPRAIRSFFRTLQMSWNGDHSPYTGTVQRVPRHWLGLLAG